MAMDFSKFDNAITDLEAFKKDVDNAGERDTGDFPEVPVGKYEVKVKKLELTVSKTSKKPMCVAWFEIVEGEYKGQLLFMNQVCDKPFQIHIINELLKSLGTDVAIKFESFSQYAEMILDVAEAIDGKFEYALDYGNRNGFNTFKILEIFDV